MRKFRVVMIFLVLVANLFSASGAWAHPLGNFTINHYAGLTISRDHLAVDYVLDMAEIPAFQTISAMDTNENANADPDEAAAYAPTECEAIRTQLALVIDGRRTALATDTSAIEFPPGQGGLPTLRLNCTYRAAISIQEGSLDIAFQDDSYAERLGWREMVIAAEGVKAEGAFSTTSASNRLTQYPEDMLSSPLDQRQISLRVSPGTGSADLTQDEITGTAPSMPANRNDAFTRLITMETITFPTLAIALLISIAWGAMHALTPGHGKSIVGAYLVGSRGTARHAVLLGLTTTITHTAGVYLLGLITLVAARYILPEKIFPWLSLASGILVVAIGFSLLLSRLRHVFNQGHEHGHEHAHLHPHADDHSHPHDPLHPHKHDHEHPHPHEHAHEHPHPHTELHDHDHEHAGHTHLPPGADGSPVTLRSLLALGVSGGLLPCPSALVVLLSAIALDRVGLGLLLVLAFSTGLAGVLTGIGLVFVYARRWFERMPAQGRLLSLIPAMSALFILLVGLGIALRAVIEMGWLA